VFSFVIWYTFVVLLFVSWAITNQISINSLDYNGLHVGFLSDILTWSLFWGPKFQRKAYWKFPAFNLSTAFCGVLKMNFDELKFRFFQTKQCTLYGTYDTFFDSLEFSKYIFIWNMIYIRVLLICFRSYQLPNFDQLTRLLSITCRFIDWHINMVLILRTQSVDKCLLEISTFVFLLFVSNLSAPKFRSTYSTVSGYMWIYCLI
jgi:hypothetical protein